MLKKQQEEDQQRELALRTTDFNRTTDNQFFLIDSLRSVGVQSKHAYQRVMTAAAVHQVQEISHLGAKVEYNRVRSEEHHEQERTDIRDLRADLALIFRQQQDFFQELRGERGYYSQQTTHPLVTDTGPREVPWDDLLVVM